MFILACTIVIFSNSSKADQVEFRHKVFTLNSIWNFDQFIPPDGGKLDYRYRFELYNKRLGLEWTIFSLGGHYKKLHNDYLGSTTLDMKLGPTFAFCNYFELYAGAGPQGYLFGGYRSGNTEEQNGYILGSWGVVVDAGARITLKSFFVSASYTPNIPLGGEPGTINSGVEISKFDKNNIPESIGTNDVVDLNNIGRIKRIKGTWHNNYSLSLGFIW
jgi:hypothetical protein